MLAARSPGPVAVPPGVRVVRAATPVPARLQRGGAHTTGSTAGCSCPTPLRLGRPGDRARGRTAPRGALRRDPLELAPPERAPRRREPLARTAGVPWLADFRDPWTHNQFRVYPTPAHRALDAALGRGALAGLRRDRRQPGDPRRARRRRPRPAGRARGAARTGSTPPSRPTGRISATASGSSTRAASTGAGCRSTGSCAPSPRCPATSRLLFLGVAAACGSTLTRELGLGARVRVEPMAPHSYALGCQRAAAALVLINGLRPEAMSSKVFEYLASGRPIFAITPAVSAARSSARRRRRRHVRPARPAHGRRRSRTFVADVRAGTAPSATAAALAHYVRGHSRRAGRAYSTGAPWQHAAAGQRTRGRCPQDRKPPRAPPNRPARAAARRRHGRRPHCSRRAALTAVFAAAAALPPPARRCSSWSLAARPARPPPPRRDHRRRWCGLLVLLIPLTALLGPSFALPAFPQLFRFRIVLAVVSLAAPAGAPRCARRCASAPRTFALLFALWYGWLVVSLVWAPDKAEGLRYLGVVAFMFVVVAAMAAAGRATAVAPLCWVGGRRLRPHPRVLHPRGALRHPPADLAAPRPPPSRTP